MAKQSPVDDYLVSGSKVVGSYTYYLLVDASGACYIMREAEESATIKFAKLALNEAHTLDQRASAIDAFWTAAASQTYKYIFQA
jgi:hypothetical protein